jgi:hypothetical protein
MRCQARGRALLNLRVSELEGGLLGRTLITLVPNKGWRQKGGDDSGSSAAPASGSASASAGGGRGPPAAAAAACPSLPPHKFGTHDVVALRPSKGSPDVTPLCSGVWMDVLGWVSQASPPHCFSALPSSQSNSRVGNPVLRPAGLKHTACVRTFLVLGLSGHDKPWRSAYSKNGFCAAGVIYRVTDSSMVVAVDEAPDEGLEQPLRLDKLANEVRCVLCVHAGECTGGPFPVVCSCSGFFLTRHV